MGIEQIVILIRVGALRFTSKSKKELLWEVHLLIGQKSRPVNNSELFQIEKKNYSMHVLTNTALENACHELELLGYPVTLSMFDLLKTAYRGEIRTQNLRQYIIKIIKIVGLYVCEKTVHTKNNKKMWFGTFLDANGNFFTPPIFRIIPPAIPFAVTVVT